jgi:hypothetical protein
VIRALNEIRPDRQVYVRTTAPRWLFPEAVNYSRGSIDVGIVQQDSLAMDIEATLEQCRSLLNDAPGVIAQELAFIRRHAIGLVAGDIPALAFEIAARAGIPSAAITNFAWTEIYREYARELPQFGPIIAQMAQFYGRATILLALPYSLAADVFPRKEAIPWIARQSQIDKQTARKEFGLPAGAIIVLLSFGGLGLQRLPWEKLKLMRDFLFVVSADEHEIDGNIFAIPEAQHHYQDLVRAVDVVVTKPGYGIVADVISHRAPVLYTDRGGFPEYPHLVQALHDCATAEFIPQSELLAGNIAPYLTRLLKREPHWPVVALNGAQVAAEKLLALMER